MWRKLADASYTARRSRLIPLRTPVECRGPQPEVAAATLQRAQGLDTCGNDLGADPIGRNRCDRVLTHRHQFYELCARTGRAIVSFPSFRKIISAPPALTGSSRVLLIPFDVWRARVRDSCGHSTSAGSTARDNRRVRRAYRNRHLSFGSIRARFGPPSARSGRRVHVPDRSADRRGDCLVFRAETAARRTARPPLRAFGRVDALGVGGITRLPRHPPSRIRFGAQARCHTIGRTREVAIAGAL